MIDIKLRRSILYVPGANARALKKASSLDADALIIDLEDGVGAEEKTVARSQVVEALTTQNFDDKEITVRINCLSTPWGKEDLAILAECEGFN